MSRIPRLSFLERDVRPGDELDFYLRERAPVWGNEVLGYDKDVDILLAELNLPPFGNDWETVWLGEDWLEETHMLDPFYLLKLRDGTYIIEVV